MLIFAAVFPPLRPLETKRRLRGRNYILPKIGPIAGDEISDITGQYFGHMNGTMRPESGSVPTATRIGNSARTASCTIATPASMMCRFRSLSGSSIGTIPVHGRSITLGYPTSVSRRHSSSRQTKEDRFDLPRRHSLDVHLGRRCHRCLLAALIAFENLGRKSPVAILRNSHLELSDPRNQAARVIAAPVAQASFHSLSFFSPRLLGSFLTICQRPLYLAFRRVPAKFS